jgi:hypothetical protein
MKEVLKTMTLGKNEPSVVICPGHVSAKVFNKAYQAEGWSGSGGYKQDVLKYVYCIEKKLKKGLKFKQVAPNVEGAKPFTWTSWD